jgi:hypothetical protein
MRTVIVTAATDSGVLGSVTGVRPLLNGSVLVNDYTRRRVLLIDSTGTSVRVVADTIEGAALPYGSPPIALLPYVGDSTVMIDQSARAFVVLDSRGNAVRTAAAPVLSDIRLLVNSALGAPGVDPSGRWVYRADTRSRPLTGTANV